MTNTAKLWHMSVKVMQIMGNIIILQVFNLLLMIIGFNLLLLPMMIIIDIIMINNFIFGNENITFKNLLKAIKNNYQAIIVYTVGCFLLMLSYQQNSMIQEVIISNNLSIISELLSLMLGVIIFISMYMFIIYFPLVNNSSNQTMLTKIKVTFMLPFYKLKVTLFLVISTIINTIFFTNNLLFIILFDPVLLLAANLIIFKNQILLAEKKINKGE